MKRNFIVLVTFTFFMTLENISDHVQVLLKLQCLHNYNRACVKSFISILCGKGTGVLFIQHCSRLTIKSITCNETRTMAAGVHTYVSS